MHHVLRASLDSHAATRHLSRRLRRRRVGDRLVLLDPVGPAVTMLHGRHRPLPPSWRPCSLDARFIRRNELPLPVPGENDRRRQGERKNLSLRHRLSISLRYWSLIRSHQSLAKTLFESHVAAIPVSSASTFPISCSRWWSRSPRRRSSCRRGASSCRRSCTAARRSPCRSPAPAARPRSAPP